MTYNRLQPQQRWHIQGQCNTNMRLQIFCGHLKNTAWKSTKHRKKLLELDLCLLPSNNMTHIQHFLFTIPSLISTGTTKSTCGHALICMKKFTYRHTPSITSTTTTRVNLSTCSMTKFAYRHTTWESLIVNILHDKDYL